MKISVYHVGPALGSALYSLGGFPLPFLSVGTFGLIVAISLYFVVPDVQANQNDSPDDDRKVLNLSGIAKVSISTMLLNVKEITSFS